MEKIKADILITGDLICKEYSTGGGGKIYSCKKEDLHEWFDVHSAVIIDGDVLVDSFDSKEYTVVVCGANACKGGCYGK